MHPVVRQNRNKKFDIAQDGARRTLLPLARTDASTPRQTSQFPARPRLVAVQDFKRLLHPPSRSNVRGTTNRADVCRRWRKGVNDQLMWLRRSLDALHGCHGVGNGAGIDLEAQVARWPSASCGSSLLRCALTGPRGGCAEQVLVVPKASIWTLLGVLSMQSVHQHRLERAECASKAWSSPDSSHFALALKHTVAVPVLPSWFWSIFSTTWDGRRSFLRPRSVDIVARWCVMRVVSI